MAARASSRAVAISTTFLVGGRWLRALCRAAREALQSRVFLRLNGHTADAVSLLRSADAGEVGHTGEWLVVTCPAGEKARALEVLVAAGGEPELLPFLVQAFKSMQARTLAHASVPGWTARANQAGLMSGPWNVGDLSGGPLKAVVFDASGLRTIDRR